MPCVCLLQECYSVSFLLSAPYFCGGNLNIMQCMLYAARLHSVGYTVTCKKLYYVYYTTFQYVFQVVLDQLCYGTCGDSTAHLSLAALNHQYYISKGSVSISTVVLVKTPSSDS